MASVDETTFASTATYAMGMFLGALLAPDVLSEEVEVARWGVVAAVAGTAALAYIGFQANRLVQRAQAREEHLARERERMLLAYLSSEWRMVCGELEIIAGGIEQAGGLTPFATAQSVRQHLERRISAVTLTLTEAKLDQIVGLPSRVDVQVGEALGALAIAKSAAYMGANMMTPGAYKDEMGDLIEPTEPTAEALDQFKNGYGAFVGSVRLALRRLKEARAVHQAQIAAKR